MSESDASTNEAEHSGGQGRLIICATPIGNLGDVTERVLGALREADVVCAEDTRVTGRLLSAYDISKHLERLDEALIGKRIDAIIDRVQSGEIIAYCTDAGMPGVSDPGMRLVAAAHEAHVAVEVLPGASSAILAYVLSGCANAHYYFGGFLPRKEGERRSLLEGLRTLDAALIFYESPNRIVSALMSIADVFPLREMALCRELTKMHEETVRARTQDMLDEFRSRSEKAAVKGEIVIVIDGPNEDEAAEAAAKTHEDARICAAEFAAQGLRAKDIASRLAFEFDLARNEAYDIALQAVEDIPSF